VTQIPQPNPASASDSRTLLSQYVRQFLGVYTRSARTAVPDGYFYNLENVIPIGDQNMPVVPNISGPLHDYAADIIYWSQNVNLAGTEFLVNFASNGKVFLYNIGSGASTQINPSNLLSGAGSQCAQWSNTVLLLIDSTGYYSYDGTTFAHITGTGVPTSGSTIAVYENRVWITQARALLCSGANDYTAASWTPANGAGTFNLTDPTLRTAITRTLAANGYLYIWSATGVTAVSNVFVPTGAATPTPSATITNLQALIGTDQPASIFPYDRNVMFASRYGIHNLIGVDAPKISADIDGTWRYVDFSQPIYGGQCVVEGILCAGFLIKRNGDPIFGSNTIVVLWYSRDNTNANTGVDQTTDIFWFANFGAITVLSSGFVNNVPALFAFIGNKLFQLFADETSAPSTAVWSKLYPMEDELARKEVMQAGLYADFTLLGTSIQLSIDTPSASSPVNTQVGILSGTWINVSGTQGQWKNLGGVLGGWAAPAPVLLTSIAPPMYDHYVGFRLTTTGYSYNLHLLAMDYKLGDRWM
jgi:hypothetical protein